MVPARTALAYRHVRRVAAVEATLRAGAAHWYEDAARTVEVEGPGPLLKESGPTGCALDSVRGYNR